MAAYDLEEQEQLSAIKAWWEQNGNMVTGVILAIALVVAGMQGWRLYQARQAADAGALYGAFSQAVQQKDLAKIRQLSGELVSKHGSSVSAELAALTSAKLELEGGDAKSARSKLEWAVASEADELLRDIARLRLAALLLDEKSFDEALKTLEKVPAVPFLARFEDLRGDILYAKGAVKEARESYQKAIAATVTGGQQQATFKAILETKLEALGGV